MAKNNDKRAERMARSNRNVNRAITVLMAGVIAEFYLLMVNNYYVKDNDKLIAELTPKDKTIFYTTSGKHRISCSWITGTSFEHFSEFKPNEEAVYHCGVYNVGNGYINRTE